MLNWAFFIFTTQTTLNICVVGSEHQCVWMTSWVMEIQLRMRLSTVLPKAPIFSAYYEQAAKSLSNQAVLSINQVSRPIGHSFIAASDTSCWKVKSEALYLDYVAFWCFSLSDVPAKDVLTHTLTHLHTDSQKGPFCHLKAKEQDRPPTATAETVRLLWALTA